MMAKIDRVIGGFVYKHFLKVMTAFAVTLVAAIIALALITEKYAILAVAGIAPIMMLLAVREWYKRNRSSRPRANPGSA